MVVALALFGFTAIGFSDPGSGRGYGYGCCKGEGYNSDCPRQQGRGMKRYGDEGYGRRMGMERLSDEQRAKVEAEREAFFEATRDLRQQLRQKNLAMRAELAKQSPEADKVRALQGEMSDLHGQLAQKRIDHLLNMKAIDPELGNGFGGRGDCWR
jgi:Spy/CpxP family protein refolding chaperone